MKLIAPIYITLILLILSCQTTRQERQEARASKRIEKIYKRFPDLKQTTIISVVDTIIKGQTTFDTVLSTSVRVDTVIIHKENNTIKYFPTGDSVYISVKEDPDTVYIKKEIPVETFKPTKIEEKWWNVVPDSIVKILILFIVFLIILMISRHLSK